MWRSYAAIFVAEIVLFLAFFQTGWLEFRFLSYKKLIISYWLPYFLAFSLIARPYAYQNLFVAGMQGIYTTTIHAVLMNLTLLVIPRSAFFAHLPIYLILYTALYVLFSPLLLIFFDRIFLKYRSLPLLAFWKYAAWLPILLSMYTGALSLKDGPLAHEYLIPRVFHILAGLFIAIIIYKGMKLIAHQVDLQRKNHLLAAQIEASRDYTHSMLNSQDQLKAFYDSRKAYLDKLEGLISSHQPQEALQFIKEIGTQLDQTKRKQYCQNPLVNAALSTYLAKAEALHIPITVKAVIPKENAALSSDLAIVLSNLIENAIHASEKQADNRRALSLLTICQSDILSILVKNRFDGTVDFDEDCLPTTQASGHGIGMKSLIRFRDTYDASLLCTFEDGWFSTYIRVPWGGAA